jgi:uncharacterized membrane protein YqhA
VRRLIESSRYLAVVGVVFGLVAAAAAFGWDGVKTVALVWQLVRGDPTAFAPRLLRVMDSALIAAGLLIFSLGLYELFIGKLQLPEWLVIEDLDTLKARLAGIVVLVMAVEFVERLETEAVPLDLLYTGLAVAVVSAPLLLYRRRDGSG